MLGIYPVISAARRNGHRFVEVPSDRLQIGTGRDVFSIPWFWTSLCPSFCATVALLGVHPIALNNEEQKMINPFVRCKAGQGYACFTYRSSVQATKKNISIMIVWGWDWFSAFSFEVEMNETSETRQRQKRDRTIARIVPLFGPSYRKKYLYNDHMLLGMDLSSLNRNGL